MDAGSTFDPFFNTAPLRKNDNVVPERRRFLFDGWSYEPLAADRQEPLVVPASPQR